MQLALSQLQAEGYLISKIGSGVYVSAQKIISQLRQRNIACKALSNCYLCAPKKHGLILGFAHMQKNEIIQGISDIRECIASIERNKDLSHEAN